MNGNYNYNESMQKVANARRLAEILAQQSQKIENPMRGSEGGGYVIPYQPLEGLAKVAQALSGAYINQKADEEEKQASSDHRKMLMDALASGDRNQMIAATGEDGLMEALKQQIKPKDSPHMNQVIYGKDKNGNTVAYGAGSDFSAHPMLDVNGEPIMVDRYKTGENMIVQPTSSGPVLHNIPGTEQAVESQSAAKERGNQSQHIFTNVPNSEGGTNTVPGSVIQGQVPVADDHMINAIIHSESGGNPNAVSNKNAIGLMQIIPSTGAMYGASKEDLLNPKINMQVGTSYYNDMLKRYGGNEELALAAYNAGPGAVDKYGGIPPYPETQAYVKKVMGFRDRYSSQAQNQQNIPQQNPVVGQSPSLAEQEIIKEGIKKQAEVEAARAKQQIELDAVAPKVKAEAQAKYSTEAPTDIANGYYMIDVIDKALNHKGLKNSVGAMSMLGLSHIPGTKEHDFSVVMDQLKGKAFLNAYQNLKGGGQITELEGQKATDAIGRISTSQTEEEFRAGLNELKSIINQCIERSKKKAGITSDSKPVQSTSGIKFIGFE
jgi:hypothetical protein